MKKKLKENGGFTLVEMLCAVAILVLLCLMLNTGMQMAVRTYREITAESETQLLLNTLVDAIAGELRFAHEVDGAGEVFTYNGGRSLSVNSQGRVVVSSGAGEIDLLPKGKTTDGSGYGGAYHGGAYQARQMDGPSAAGAKPFITYDKDMACFTVNLRVVWRDGDVSAETPQGGVVIRCLNPPAEKKTETGGGTTP